MTDEATLAAWVREYSDTFGFAFHAGDPKDAAALLSRARARH